MSKLNDAESEAAETQCWIHFAVECGYLSKDMGKEIYTIYDNIIGKLVKMITNPHPWVIPRINR